MSYIVRYSRHIDWMAFKKLPVNDKKRLKRVIEEKLQTDPLTFGKPLRKSLKGCRSLRVGEYRIVYRIENRNVDILLFGHRSNVYLDAEGAT